MGKFAVAWIAALLGCMILVAPNLGSADGLADEAELQFQLGAEAYQQGEFREALEHFLQSNRLVPNKNVTYNIARSFERLNQYSNAYRYYTDTLVVETIETRRNEIQSALDRITPHVAVLDIESDPPGATIYLQRRDLGSVGTAPRKLAVAEGTYRILAELEGYEPASSDAVTARIGTQTPVRFHLRRIVGRVKVEGVEDAAVHIDGEDGEAMCTSPCEFEVPPGLHTIYFVRQGFLIAPRQVQVSANETSTVRTELTPLTGSLVVSTDEEDALVQVDGVSVGFTPVVVSNVPVGTRHVRITLRGFVPIERDVEVRLNSQSELRDLTLLPVREVSAPSRHPEQLEDAPSSVTVIGPQELQAFAYPTIYEALRGVRGMALSWDGVYSSVSVRGLGLPGDYGNRLLVLSDGLVLNDNLLYQSFIGYDGRVDLEDIERIEVVRGPGSVLYGTGAVSGVLNLVPVEGERTSVRASLGTFDNSVARARGTATLRLGDQFGVSASVSAARSEGRDVALEFDADGDGTKETHVAHDADAFHALTAQLRGWRRDLKLQLFYTARDQELPIGVYGTRFDDSSNSYLDERAAAEVRYEPELSQTVQLLTRVYVNHYRFKLGFNYDATDETTGETSISSYGEHYRGAWGGGELRLIASPSDAFSISLGADAQYNPIASIETSDASGELLDERHPFTVLAGYGLVEWEPADWLRLSAGTRLDVWFADGDLTPSVNPRVALILKPTSNDIVKVMGGRAFRAPSSYELYWHDQGYTQARADCCGGQLEPETVWSGEVEYTHAFDQDWRGLLSAHALYADHFIETATVPAEVAAAFGFSPDAVYSRNSDTGQLSWGVDAELRREWRSGWSFAAVYGFLQARATGGDNEPMPNAPTHFASLKAIAPLVKGLASAALRLSLESPRRINARMDDETEYALVGDFVISGALADERFRYAAGVYNFLDWHYEVPISETSSSLTMPQYGRTFMLNLSAEW